MKTEREHVSDLNEGNEWVESDGAGVLVDCENRWRFLHSFGMRNVKRLI
jgi:hypothetical protein